MGRSLTTLALLTAIILAAALIVPAMIDWEDQRAGLEAQIAEVVGGPVELAGPVSVRLLPTPRLTAARVSFQDADGRLVVEGASLHGELALWPLLANRIVVTGVALEGGDIRLSGNATTTRALVDELAARMSIGAGEFAYVIRPARLILDDSDGDDALILTDTQIEADWAGTGTPARLTLQIGTDFRADGTFRPQEDGTWRVNLRATYREELAVLSVGGVLGRLGAGAPFDGDFALDVEDLRAALGDATEEAVGPELSLRGPFHAAGAQWTATESKLILGTMQADVELRADTGEIPLVAGHMTTTLAELDALGLQMREVRDLVTAAALRGVDVPFPRWLHGEFSLNADGLVLNDRVVRELHTAVQIFNGQAHLSRLSGTMPGGTQVLYAPRRDVAQGLTVQSESLRSLMSWLGEDVSAYPEGKLQGLNLSAALNPGQDPLRISIFGLDLDGGHAEGALTFADDGDTVITLSVTGLDLDAYAPEAGGSFVTRLTHFAGLAASRESASFNLTGERVRLAGSSVDQFRFTGAVTDGTLTIEEAEIGFTNGGTLGAQGHWAGEGEPFLLQITGENTDPGLFAGLPIAPTEPAGLLLNVSRNDRGAASLSGNVRTRGLSIDVAGDQLVGGDEPTFRGRMIARGQDPGTLASALGLDTFAAYDGAELLDLQWFGAWSQGNVSAHLELAGLSLLARGTMSAPFDAERQAQLDFEYVARSASDLIAQAGGPQLATLENVLTTGTGRVRSTATGWSISTQDTAVGGNVVAATLNWNEGAPLTGSLELDGLDLMVSADDVPDDAPEGEAGTLAWSTAPLDLSWMESARAELNVSINRLGLADVPFKDVAFHLSLDTDRVVINEARGGAGEGILTGSVQMERDDSALVITADIAGEDVPADTLFAAAGLPESFGPLTLSAQMRTRGRSPFDLIAGLEGRMNVGLIDGALDMIDMGHLADALPEVRTRRALHDAANEAVRQGETDIARLSGAVPVSRGVFTLDGLSGVAETGPFAVAGALDLRSNIVDVETTFQITDPATGTAPVVVAFRGAGEGLNTSIDITALQDMIGERLADTPEGLLSEGDLPEDLQELLRDYEHAFPEGEGAATPDGETTPAQTP